MMSRRSWIPLAALGVLSCQALATWKVTRSEVLPEPPPLSTFPTSLSSWQFSRDEFLDPAVADMLRPDDLVNRIYTNGASEASLFVAYYRTQHDARNPHDPKVCLPGSGWNVRESRVVDLPITVRTPLHANYYRIQKDDSEAVVIYWFQTHKRTVASEQSLRFYKVIDTVKDHRSDMALARIVVPVLNGDVKSATEKAFDMSRLTYPQLLPYFPAHIE